MSVCIADLHFFSFDLFFYQLTCKTLDTDRGDALKNGNDSDKRFEAELTQAASAERRRHSGEVAVIKAHMQAAREKCDEHISSFKSRLRTETTTAIDMLALAKDPDMAKCDAIVNDVKVALGGNFEEFRTSLRVLYQNAERTRDQARKEAEQLIAAAASTAEANVQTATVIDKMSRATERKNQELEVASKVQAHDVLRQAHDTIVGSTITRITALTQDHTAAAAAAVESRGQLLTATAAAQVARTRYALSELNFWHRSGLYYLI